MLKGERMPENVELACGRIDEFVSQAGPELGRWMAELAERYAAGSCRRRTLKPAALHQRPSSGARR